MMTAGALFACTVMVGGVANWTAEPAKTPSMLPAMSPITICIVASADLAMAQRPGRGAVPAAPGGHGTIVREPCSGQNPPHERLSHCAHRRRRQRAQRLACPPVRQKRNDGRARGALDRETRKSCD